MSGMAPCANCGDPRSQHDCAGHMEGLCGWVYYADEGGSACACHPWLGGGGGRSEFAPECGHPNHGATDHICRPFLGEATA